MPFSYLFGLEQFGIKFGLENIQAIVERLGHPERAYRTVHVAGTNGKGSVTAMVDAALRAAGHRTARYTSPHLVDLTERFVIDGRAVPREVLATVVADVRDAVEAMRSSGALEVQPTFFEVTTAVAFEVFRRAGVELAVVEVGLGGRLDATNVIAPEATAITSIALDHEQYLGRSLAGIAAEKAGTIKPRVPVVIGDLGPEADAVVERIAEERVAPLVRARADVTIAVLSESDPTIIRLRTPARDYGEISLALRGAHQVSNAIVAVRLLEVLDSRGISVPPDAIVSGLERTQWPARLDLRRLPDGRELILDAAHNPQGARALAAYLDTLAGARLPLVFGAMRDKDAIGMFTALLPSVGSLVLTRAANERSADPAALADLARAVAPHRRSTIEPSLDAALAAAWESSPRIVVAGSIFLLGDVLQRIS